MEWIGYLFTGANHEVSFIRNNKPAFLSTQLAVYRITGV
jgi:hypothetical protein